VQHNIAFSHGADGWTPRSANDVLDLARVLGVKSVTAWWSGAGRSISSVSVRSVRAESRHDPITIALIGAATDSATIMGNVALLPHPTQRTGRQVTGIIRSRSKGAASFRVCRVGPGNFTPSPSRNRTGYSRIIRLVPSREGRRLPLNEGLLPASQLAQISGDDLPPSLHDHYSRFHTTTRQSAPRRRIGTFGLAVGAACAFSLGIAGKVLTFRTGA
jgi:hypothetical protein